MVIYIDLFSAIPSLIPILKPPFFPTLEANLVTSGKFLLEIINF